VSFVLGLDLGTQSAKAVVYDPQLRVRGRGRAAIATHYPRAGWAEQDPGAWEVAVGAAIAAALVDAQVGARQIAGLGLTGQLDGMIAVDEAGAPLGPCLPWLDRRATAAMPALDDDAVLALTGQVVDASHLAGKARWWDRHGGGPRAARFHQPVSYLVERLTGARVLDHGLASTTLLYDLAGACWSPAQLSAFDLDRARLPTIADAHARAGTLHARGAASTGLVVGTPVAVGTGDDFATGLGIGLPTGALLCAIGTAEVVAARGPITARDLGRLVEVHPEPRGGGLLENPGWAAGGAIAWLAALTGRDAAALDAEVAAIGPGADGVTYVPALGGAMVPVWNPRARGAFVGLGAGHDAGHLARAIYEACAVAMTLVGERIASLGAPCDAIHLVGGGARADTWAQIRADVAGLPVARWDDPDACPRGAAMLAWAALDGAGALDAAVALAPPPVAWSTPDPRVADRYAAVRAQVLSATAALAPIDEAHTRAEAAVRDASHSPQSPRSR